jgi:hypothetical protein
VRASGRWSGGRAGEVVEAQHFDQQRRRLLGLVGRSSQRLNCFCARRVVLSMLAMPCSNSAVSSPSVTKAIWLRRSASRLLTGVAESISTRVLTPSG